MKAPTLLTLLSVAALAAMTLDVSAGQPFQSPRAKANDAKVITTTTAQNTAAVTRPAGVAPRAYASQSVTVKGATGSAATTARCGVIGSPKQVANAGANCCAANSAGCRVTGPCCAMK